MRSDVSSGHVVVSIMDEKEESAVSIDLLKAEFMVIIVLVRDRAG